MSLTSTRLQNALIDPLAVVANLYAQAAFLVVNRHFDLFRIGVAEGVAQRLHHDPADLIAHQRRQVHRRAFHFDAKTRPAAVETVRGEFFPDRADGAREIVARERRRTQALDGIAALLYRPTGLIDALIEKIPRPGIVREHVGNRGKLQQDALKALQQRVVQVARDAGALVDALLHAEIELP